MALQKDAAHNQGLGGVAVPGDFVGFGTFRRRSGDILVGNEAEWRRMLPAAAMFPLPGLVHLASARREQASGFRA